MTGDQLTIEFTHHRHVYRMYIEDTGFMIDRPYQIHKPQAIRRRPEIIPELIRSAECKECHELKINGLCVNKLCPSNSSNVTS